MFSSGGAGNNVLQFLFGPLDSDKFHIQNLKKTVLIQVKDECTANAEKEFESDSK